MQAQEVVTHYGGISKVAKELGISYQAVRGWIQKGEVPEGRQWQLQAMSGGTLKVSVSCTAGAA